jgi:hypothetical protein
MTFCTSEKKRTAIAGTNKCVDAAAEDSSTAQLWECSRGEGQSLNQRWRMEGESLIPMSDGLCLQGSSQGLWERAECNQGEKQAFRIDVTSGNPDSLTLTLTLTPP